MTETMVPAEQVMALGGDIVQQARQREEQDDPAAQGFAGMGRQVIRGQPEIGCSSLFSGATKRSH